MQGGCIPETAIAAVVTCSRATARLPRPIGGEAGFHTVRVLIYTKTILSSDTMPA